MPIKGNRGSWGGVQRTGIAVIAAAIRAHERRIAQRLRRKPGLWAKLLEGRGAVWLAGGPRARARGGVGPWDSEGARRERSRGSRRGRHGGEEGAVRWGRVVGERRGRRAGLVMRGLRERPCSRAGR